MCFFYIDFSKSNLRFTAKWSRKHRVPLRAHAQLPHYQQPAPDTTAAMMSLHGHAVIAAVDGRMSVTPATLPHVTAVGDGAFGRDLVLCEVTRVEPREGISTPLSTR